MLKICIIRECFAEQEWLLPGGILFCYLMMIIIISVYGIILGFFDVHLVLTTVTRKVDKSKGQQVF